MIDLIYVGSIVQPDMTARGFGGTERGEGRERYREKKWNCDPMKRQGEGFGN